MYEYFNAINWFYIVSYSTSTLAMMCKMGDENQFLDLQSTHFLCSMPPSLQSQNFVEIF